MEKEQPLNFHGQWNAGIGVTGKTGFIQTNMYVMSYTEQDVNMKLSRLLALDDRDLTFKCLDLFFFVISSVAGLGEIF